MAMRRSGFRLSLLAGRAVGAALRPLQSSALYSTTSDSDYLLGTLPETMKAAVLWEPRKPMTIEELKFPRPQFGEVLVRTKGAISHLLEPHHGVTVFAGSMHINQVDWKLIGSLNFSSTIYVSESHSVNAFCVDVLGGHRRI
jgi:hypothetical protein